jgi:hypothetical protein
LLERVNAEHPAATLHETGRAAFYAATNPVPVSEAITVRLYEFTLEVRQTAYLLGLAAADHRDNTPMAKTNSKDKTEVQELKGKVLRRAKKLTKQLRRLVAQTDPDRSMMQTLLGALEKALPKLKSIDGANHSDDSANSRSSRRVALSSIRTSGK